MKYRLKNRELQAKLDDISGGDFSKALAQADLEEGTVIVSFGKSSPILPGDEEPYEGHAFVALFLVDDLEPIHRYDPYGWNLWPEVTPPEGVLMRLEYVDKCGAKRKTCAMVSRKMCGIVSKGVWTNFDGYEIDIDKGRFRPWEDDE